MANRRRVRKQGTSLVVAYLMRVAMISLFIFVGALALNVFTKGDDEANSDAKKNAENRNDKDVSEIMEWSTERAQRLPRINQEVTVMVDPGHGGDDPGTSSLDGKVYEKDITWDISLKVQAFLQEAGVDTVLSRAEDEFINKHDRAYIANEQDVDLFVSIHCNYLENDTKTSGVETYYVEGAEDGEALANLVHKQVLSITEAADMYVRTNDFVVIKDTNMPAILIETGYLSSPKDVELLCTDNYKSKMAYGIAAGIIEYINSQE